jgi:hypothetical protein
MEFLLELAHDLARDLAIVTLVLAVLCAAGWAVLQPLDSEKGHDPKQVPPDQP